MKTKQALRTATTLAVVLFMITWPIASVAAVGGAASSTGETDTQEVVDGAGVMLATSSVPAAPYVNLSDQTYDPVTETTLKVQYNASGQGVAASDLIVDVRKQNGDGWPNTSLTTKKGNATITIGAFGGWTDLSGDVTLDVLLINGSNHNRLAKSKVNLTANPSPYGYINGTIKNGSGTIPDAKVNILNSSTFKFVNSAKTDANGNYSIPVATGTYAVDVKKPNHFNETISGQTVNQDATTVVNATLLAKKNGGTINGTVTNGSGAVVGTTVTIIGQSGTSFYDTATTDSNGDYSIQVPPGTFVVEIKDSNHINVTTFDNKVEKQKTTTVDFQLTSYANAGTITGDVTNQTGVPVTNVKVDIINESTGQFVTSATTDANGNYSAFVEPGSYEVIIFATGYEFELVTGVKVGTGGSQVVDITLTETPPTGFINGTVVDPQGTPVSQVGVSAADSTFTYFDSDFNSSGNAFSLQVPSGEYTVRADIQGYPAAIKEDVNVTAGQTNQITLQLQESAYINGTVLNASGQPALKSFVVIDTDEGFRGGPVNQQGRYNVTVPPGDYTVSVFALGGDAPSQDVSVAAGEVNTTDFQLVKTEVVHTNVTIESGPGDQSKLDVLAGVQAGLLMVQVVNDSYARTQPGGPPSELETAGLTENTNVSIEVTVSNFTPTSLLWGIDNARWDKTTNSSNSDYTDVTINGSPVTLQVNFSQGIGPLIGQDPSNAKWPTGNSDRATDGRNQTIYLGLFDLSTLPGDIRSQLAGMSATTNAQRFSMPSVKNNSLRVWVGAPSKTVEGVDHGGFYQATIPQKQLDAWGVTNPEQELSALYKGSSTNFTVTNITNGGARIRIDNISYSAGYVEIQADTGAPSVSGVSVVDNSGDDILTDGESVTVSATVKDTDGVDTVLVDASVLGGSSTLELTDGDNDDEYDATLTVDRTNAADDGTYRLTITANDTKGNTTIVETAKFELDAWDPPEDQVFNATAGVDVWERSVLPLRADSSSAGLQISNARWLLTLETDGSSIGSTTLNKDPVGVYTTGSNIPVTFKNGRAVAESQFDYSTDNTKVQLIAARLEANGSSNFAGINTVDDVRELMEVDNANENATFEMVDSITLDSAGDGSFTFTPSKPGQYVLIAATNESGGFSVDSNGNISLAGQTTIVGFDQVMVQNGRSTISTDKSSYQAGSNVTVTANTSSVVKTGAGENTSHVVLVYDEKTFVNETFELVVKGTITENFNIGDNVTLKHTIGSVNGVANIRDNVTFLGVKVTENHTDGSPSFGSIIEFIENDTKLTAPKTTATGTTVWNASVTVVNSTANDTIVVETSQRWPTGEYRVVHFATNENGTQIAANTATIDVTAQSASFDFDNESLTVSPNPALTTEDINVSVNVTNSGKAAGNVTADVEADGSVIQQQTQEIGAGKTATLTITISAGTLSAGTYSLNVSGAGPVSLQVNEATPDVKLNRTSIGYGSVGATADGSNRVVEAINITNNGTDTLSISTVSLIGADSDQFDVTGGDTAVDVAPGSSHIISVAYRPTERGSASAKVTIESNVDDSPTNVSLSGTGVEPEISLDTPGPLTATTVDVGGSSSVTITVNNTGNVPLSVTPSISDVSGSAFSLASSASFTVAPDTPKDITVDFNPSSGGDKAAKVTLTNNDSFTGTVAVRVGGTARSKGIQAAPTTVDFDNVTVNGPNTTGFVSITNNGSVPVEVAPQSPTTTTGTSTFSLSTANFTLDAGESQFVAIELNATNAGTIAGSAVFETNQTKSGSPVKASVSLTATGQQPNATVTPTSHDFGDVPVGSSTTTTLTLGNDGNSTLVINTSQAFNTSEAANFSLVAAPTTIEIEPSGSASLQVAFSPDTAATTNASLELHTNDPDSGQGVHQIDLGGVGVTSNLSASSSSVSFGDVAVNRTATSTVTVQNTGGDSLTITGVSISGSAAFTNDSISSTTIAAGDSASLPVKFSPTPSLNGSQTATLSITSGAGETFTVSLSGVGKSPQAAFKAATVPVDAGYVKAGSSSTASVTVRNTGIANTTLNITSVSITGTDSADFSQSVSTPVSIAGGQSHTFTITFNPSTNGGKSATLTVETNAGSDSTLTTSLRGTGSAPISTVSTTSLGFDKVGTGFSLTKSVTVTNDGGSPLGIQSVSLSGADASHYSITKNATGESVVAGGTTTVKVTFAPTAKGTLSTADLVVDTNDSTHTISLSGEGTAPNVEITNSSGTITNQSTIPFGETAVGSSASTTFTVKNTGSATLKLPQPSITGADVSVFSVASGQGDLRIPAGTSETFVIAYAPTATGSNESTVVFSGMNDPDTARFELNFTGTGTKADATLDPASVSFGTVSTGDTETVTMTLKNVGGASMTVSQVAVSGSTAFAAESIDGRTVSAGGSTTFEVNVTPQVRGGLSGTLTITASTSAGPVKATASLGATGTEPDAEFTQIPISFGETRLGETATTTVQVNNTGNAPLNVSDVSVTGSDAGIVDVSPTSGTIGQSDSLTLSVEFSPSELGQDEGAQSATIEVATNDSQESLITRNVTGTGVTPRVTISPGAVQFGTVKLGNTVKSNVTVKNELSGTAAVNITNLRLVSVPGFDSAAYQIDTSAGFVLEPGQSQPVTINFTPTQRTPAQKFATLVIVTNDSRVLTRNVWLSNSGLKIVATYGSIREDYIQPLAGDQPTVNIDEDLDRNATLYELDVTTTGQSKNFFVKFETSKTKFSNAVGQDSVHPFQYVKVTENATDTGKFANATIRFNVTKSALSTHGVAVGEVNLRRYNGSGYEVLTTTKVGETRTEYTFEATTTEFSEFAITGSIESETLQLAVNKTSALEGQAIKFTVTQASDGAAVKDATVSISGGKSATTNANGVVNITPGQLGSLTVTASKSDPKTAFESDTESITVRQQIQLNVTASSTNVTEGDSVTFTVTSKSGGAAIKGATVSFAGNSGTTDASGKVSVTASQTGDPVTATATKSDNTTSTFLQDTVDVKVNAKPPSEDTGGDGGGGGTTGGGGADTGDTGATTSTTTTTTKVETTVSDLPAGGTVTISLDDTAAVDDPADDTGLQTLQIGVSEDSSFTITVTRDDGGEPAVNPDTGDLGYFRIEHTVSDQAVSDVTFTFRVNKDQLEDRSLESGDVALFRRTGGEWVELDTRVTGETGSAYVFEADSPGLSVFAISQTQKVATDTPTTATPEPTTPTTDTPAPPTTVPPTTVPPTTTERPGTPGEQVTTTAQPPTTERPESPEEPGAGIPWVPIIVVVVIIGAVVLLYLRREGQL